MSITKRVLDPERLRQVPKHFSWIDHRLVREHTIERADVSAWALYLFLVTVADARRDLLLLDLIAFEPPLYQVLSLPERVPVATRIARLHAVLGGQP